MNVFEDLVVELKSQNLLEDTVMDLPASSADEDILNDAVLVSPEFDVPDEGDQERSAAPASTMSDEPVSTVEPPEIGLQGNNELPESGKTKSDHEFYKKRAISEMSSLKMVEAVLSAVEREHLKVVPATYDDLDAKKSLHTFLQAAENGTVAEQKAAEIGLLKETESWCSALGDRDKQISIGNLRVYCENCKPMLSSQAMLALARFYRNLPYSESIRGKFDFIITRLFSRPMEHEARKLLFGRDQMVGHIEKLYADWSSVPLYSVDENESNTLLTALSFEELAVEAESAPAFDDLIKSDFFGRLRLFKESIAELFFAPVVTVAAIECNVRVGNVYVELINLERQKMDVDGIHQRFIELDDQVVSEAAGRTLDLADILRESGNEPAFEAAARQEEEARDHEPVAEPVMTAAKITAVKTTGGKSAFIQRLKENAFSVNRYFLAISILIIASSVGIYVWANYFADPKVPNDGVKTLSFQGTDLADQVKTAKLSGETLYIVAQPTLDTMTKDGQNELLQKLYRAGKEKGWVNVNLMNSEGRTVGYASPTRIEIVNQP